MTKIIIENIEIELTKKDIKNIRLSVYPPNGEVRISAPKSMNENRIRLFVITRVPWIRKQQSKFQNKEKVLEMEYISGESIYFFGKKYVLNVIYKNSTRSKVEIRNEEFIDLYVKEGTDKEKRGKIIKEWYRKNLKDLIPDFIEKWEKIMDLRVSDWGVKLMKTRWGTCNVKVKRIWINLELAKKPLYCLEYIIVHEMTHIIERGHGEKFKALMNQYYPQWKEVQAELNFKGVNYGKFK